MTFITRVHPRKLTHWLLHLFLIGFLPISLQAGESINVDKTNMYIAPGKSSAINSVSNPDKRRAFVTFALEEIINPRTDDETSIKLDTQNTDMPLVVTPGQAVVPAEGTLQFRVFSNDKKRDKDRFFRVVVRKLDSSPLEKHDDDKPVEKIETSLSVSLAWGVIVVVPKHNAHHQTDISMKKGVQLSNKGDSLVIIENALACHPKGGCRSAFSHRLFPGETINLCEDCPKGSTVDFDLIEGDKKSSINKVVSQ